MLNYILIFCISLFSLCLELFLTRVLNLKTFNHIVYVIIPFTMLGFGIGANAYLLLEEKIKKLKEKTIITSLLFFISISTILSLLSIVHLPISLQNFKQLLLGMNEGWPLLIAYLAVMIPYTGIGFLLIYLFSKKPEMSYKLYFWDLLGAGCGAFLFFFLIKTTQVFHSILLLCLVLFFISLGILLPKKRTLLAGLFILTIIGSLMGIPEINNYHTHKGNWENFPAYFSENQYETLSTEWHPLGRTDVYHLTNKKDRLDLYNNNEWTFRINLLPSPDFSYFSTNFLAGTPVYKLSQEGIQENQSQLKLFSQGLEAPYVLYEQPKVAIIGAGGGRDVFIAKSHGAQEIIGAEINPAIHGALTHGGLLEEYSGHIYTQECTQIYNLDGRHMIKKLPSNHFDLVVLNGVDTFSGLASGAYTFAESYLYTKEAISDYLRILNDNGMIIFYRWFFDVPRETLKLFAISLESLKTMDNQKPWEHIIVGIDPLGMTMIKKTPFTPQERLTIYKYFHKHKMGLVYPSSAFIEKDFTRLSHFDKYALAFQKGEEKNFIKNYHFDISIITDDRPFFYKYYRLSKFNPEKAFLFSARGAGYIIFLTQMLVLLQALIFIFIFIFVPLFKFKRKKLQHVPGNSSFNFITYFACLGMGFMFIEIALMQQFVLLLGSPIYSISITLACLLVFSGIGSYILLHLQKWAGGEAVLIWKNLVALFLLLLLLVLFKNTIINTCIPLPFIQRILVICLWLLPIGISLGLFFPSGLQLIKKECRGVLAWAWGVNFGFSVLGSMLAIVIAQFFGFRSILILALFVYALAAFLFQIMVKH